MRTLDGRVLRRPCTVTAVRWESPARRSITISDDIMRLLSIFHFALILAMSSCSGSSKSTGGDARTRFESRTGIVFPEEVADWGFASAQVGDTFREYYRLSCTREVFLRAAEQLELKPDALPGYPGSTLWAKSVGESTPNDPSWWRLALGSQQIFHKEDYSTVAHRSVMAFWYHDESGCAFMSVDFWD